MFRFVILGAARTGTNLLCTLLNSHPAVLCHHELFNPKGIRYALHLRETDYSLGTLEEREKHPLRFLERAWEAVEGSAVVGFKMTYRQQPKVFEQVLGDRTCQKLVVYRRNPVKRYVSHRIAAKLSEWEVYHRHELTAERPRVVVKVGELLADIEAHQKYYRELERELKTNQQIFFKVAYEDLLDPNRQKELLDFLGLPIHPLEAQSLRQNPQPLHHQIENYAELVEELRGTSLFSQLQC